MKHIILGVFLLILASYAAAQTPTVPTDCAECYNKPCYDCYLPDSIYSPRNMAACNHELDGAYLNEQLTKRARNYDFYNTMRYLQPPSLLSGAGLTSYTVNSLGYDKKNFVLDANVQFPIAIGGKRMGLNTIQIIPQFKVRIFQDDPNVPFGPNGDASLAVRTPSTIPGLAYYFSFKNWWDPNRRFVKFNWSELDPAERAELKNDTKDNRYFGVYLYHHSNGQDGAEIYPNDSVNIYNGNYGEQIVFEFIYGQQRRFAANGDNYGFHKREDRLIQQNKQGKVIFIKEAFEKELNWRVSFEWHPYSLSNEVFRDLSQLGSYPAQSRMLGRTRVNFRAAMLLIPRLIEYLSNGEKWCLISPGANYERWRFMIDFSYIIDNNYYRGANINVLDKVGPLGINRRMNLSGTAYYVLKKSRMVALFAQAGYIGNDRYNIYFNQSLWQMKFGVAFGFFEQPE